MKISIFIQLLIVLSGSTPLYSQLTGKCVEGNCKNGYGRLVTKAGEDYRGNFKDGKRLGNGTFKYSNGDVYQGMWANDLREVVGMFTFTNGRVFRGRFTNDKGKGLLTELNGRVLRGDLLSNNSFVENRSAFNALILNARKSVCGIGYPTTSTGTAFLIGNKYLATNQHVLQSILGRQERYLVDTLNEIYSPLRINLQLFDRTIYNIAFREVFRHPSIDLTIFQIDSTMDFPYPVLEIATANSPVNTNTFLIGGVNMGVKEGTLSEYYFGNIDLSSSTFAGRFRGEMAFTDIGAIPGDSGSPLFNEQGRVTGIIFMSASDLSFSGAFTLTGAVRDLIMQAIQ